MDGWKGEREGKEDSEEDVEGWLPREGWTELRNGLSRSGEVRSRSSVFFVGFGPLGCFVCIHTQHYIHLELRIGKYRAETGKGARPL